MRFLKALLLLCLITSTPVLAQKAKKAKDDKKDLWPVEIKANLLVVDGSKHYVDDVKEADIKLYENDVEQKVTYFAKKDPVTNIAFVMDNTGSMRSQLNVETALAKTLSQNLGNADEAMIVRFVSRDKITIEQPWTTEKNLLGKTFDNLFIEGGQSAITDGVYLAADKILERARNDRSKRYAIILITDGEDRDSYYRLKDLFSLTKDTDLQIFTVALMRDLYDAGFLGQNPKEESIKFVRNLAARSGGRAYIFDKRYSKEDLEYALNSVLTELRSQYVIGYTSTNQEHDGSVRKLRVEIADSPTEQKRTGIIRDSFIVPRY